MAEWENSTKKRSEKKEKRKRVKETETQREKDQDRGQTRIIPASSHMEGVVTRV